MSETREGPMSTAAVRAMIAAPRVGEWGCTVSGRRYWPEDPRPGDFDIGDIAHSLAHQCRFGGHTSVFYSVAQHSVLVSQYCDPADALWGLLHDATEAYLVDVPRPVKRSRGMERYSEIEAAFMAAIAEQFGLPPEMPASVKRADEALLAAEARDLMPPHSVRDWWLPVQPPPLLRGIYPRDPENARGEFLRRFDHLAPALAAHPTPAAEARDDG